MKSYACLIKIGSGTTGHAYSACSLSDYTMS